MNKSNYNYNYKSKETTKADDLVQFRREHQSSMKEMKDELKKQGERLKGIETSLRKKEERLRKESMIEAKEKEETRKKLKDEKEMLKKENEQIRRGKNQSGKVKVQSNTLRYHNNDIGSEEISSDEDGTPIPYRERIDYAKKKKIALAAKHVQSRNDLKKNDNRENSKAEIVDKKQDGSNGDNTSKPMSSTKCHKTAIFSTSITRNIKYGRFNDRYDDGYAKFHKFGGGLSRHMSSYMTTHLLEEKPDTAIVHHGGNDLSKDSNRLNEDLLIQETANNVIDSALLCRNTDVQDVIVSGIPIRKDKVLQRRISKLNELLQSMCQINNFRFINNNNIGLEHLHNDGVHLNDDGTKVLADNYLRALCHAHHHTDG